MAGPTDIWRARAVRSPYRPGGMTMDNHSTSRRDLPPLGAERYRGDFATAVASALYGENGQRH